MDAREALAFTAALGLGAVGGEAAAHEALERSAEALVYSARGAEVADACERCRAPRAALLDLVARALGSAAASARREQFCAWAAGELVPRLSPEEVAWLLAPVADDARVASALPMAAAAGPMARLAPDALGVEPLAGPLVLAAALADVFGVALARRGPARAPRYVATASHKSNARRVAAALAGSSPWPGACAEVCRDSVAQKQRAPCRSGARRELVAGPWPPAVVLRGPRGAGRTAAVAACAAACGAAVREFVLDDAADARGLLGYHEFTDGGAFMWRQGPLAKAVGRGEWAVFEDVDALPLEVLALLKVLASRGALAAPGRSLASEHVDAHLGFRLLGTTCREAPSFLGSDLWAGVEVEAPARRELLAILRGAHPGVPAAAAAAVVGCCAHDTRLARRCCARLEARVFPRDAATAHIPECLRSRAALEVLDVVGARERAPGAAPWGPVAVAFGVDAAALAARWSLAGPPEAAPSVSVETGAVRAGRVRLTAWPTAAAGVGPFATTAHAARLLERVAACAASREACLLVGEPGCGKTTVVQRLAALTGARLRVLNLSHATDAEELLGGVRPVAVAESGRRLHADARAAFVATFDLAEAANARFLAKLDAARSASRWSR
eukprot:CAMPEP_0119296860 /NCGR_PEP_ID=MMETSP1329-20130426/50785_1 /TAXON_ID=114041 /ORGANISM="Genus nov. species nov., Strain RCC1024" /LENGTH=617 /DNA_ID=CAMNT_0007297801 /DNA_START=225 /DNA_END=2076 /DNA_ORIENTATION=+